MGLLRTTTALGVFALLACGPKNPAPHSVPNEIRAGAAGMTEDAGVPAREMGATSSTPTTPAQEPLLPSQFGDPPPLKSAKQWLFDFEFESSRAAGENIRLLSTSEALLETPRETPRVMGRFALELWEKDRLLERARFDFPLLAMTPDAKPLTDAGAPSGPISIKAPPRLDRFIKTRIGVYFPNVARGQTLVLVDRGADKRYPLPWPPKVAR